MNHGHHSGIPRPFHAPYGGVLRARYVESRAYILSPADVGVILRSDRNHNTTSSWILPGTSQAAIPPLSTIYVAYKGATYLELVPGQHVTAYIMGETKEYTSATPLRLYGTVGFATLRRGFGENWYLSGAGLTG